MSAVMHFRRAERVGLAPLVDVTACGVSVSWPSSGTVTMFPWSVTCEACLEAMTEAELDDRRVVAESPSATASEVLSSPGRPWLVSDPVVGEVVVETGGRRRVLFDGVALPWAVAEDGVSVFPAAGLSRVQVEFLVQRVRVVDVLEDGPS